MKRWRCKTPPFLFSERDQRTHYKSILIFKRVLSAQAYDDRERGIQGKNMQS